MKTLFQQTGAPSSREAAMQRIGDVDGLLPTETDLSTPIISAQDGPRIMGKGLSNFGGKKAAPFKKGGGRRSKVLAAKSAVAGAKAGKMDADGDKG